MATFSNLPGELNLAIVQGDDLSLTVDFSVALTGYTVTSDIVSLVDGSVAVSPTVSVTDAASGIVSISLSETQTAALPAGSWRWHVEWISAGEESRRVLSGIAEVKP